MTPQLAPSRGAAHRGLPFRGIVFGLGQFGDVERGVAQGDQRFPARQYDRIGKPLIPRHRLTPLCEQVRPRLAAAFWRIDNNAFANDEASNQLKFELVISGQRFTGLHGQQLDTSLNI
jgi:hypothetical protein